MSLSKPSLSNPCEKWIGFKGSSGKFQYWDKEKEKEVELQLPLKFIVLDEMVKISGYNNATDSGIYSNEVKSTRKEQLHVRTWKGGEEIKGLYADIKDSIVRMGGKFTRSIYVALVTGKDVELANLELRGAAFSGWLAWRKKKKETDFSKLLVMITGTEEGKTGSITYKVPIVGEEPLTNKEWCAEAMRLDKELQQYFRARNEQQEEAVLEMEEEEEIPSDLSF